MNSKHAGARVLMVALALSAGTLLRAQSTDDLGWLQDMPTVTEVRNGIRGADTAQTLAWQCAVLTNLLLARDFPTEYSISPPAAYSAQVRTLKDGYRTGIREVQEEYSRSVKPLGDPENSREFALMCGADGARVDRDGRRVSPQVPQDQWLALLKPSVRAIVQAATDERSSNQQAASARHSERQLDERQTFLEGLRIVAAITASVLAGIACLVVAARSTRSVRKARFERTNRAGVQEFTNFESMESLRSAEAARMALAKVLAVLGGALIILGPFLIAVML
jgi:hypothetical protein